MEKATKKMNMVSFIIIQFASILTATAFVSKQVGLIICGIVFFMGFIWMMVFIFYNITEKYINKKHKEVRSEMKKRDESIMLLRNKISEIIDGYNALRADHINNVNATPKAREIESMQINENNESNDFI